MREKTKRSLLVLVLIVGAAIMFFPFLWTLSTSLSPGAGLDATPQLVPDDPSISAYQTLFAELPFARIILNSLGLAVATAVFQLVTSSLAAYAFSRLPFRGRQWIFTHRINDALLAIFISDHRLSAQIIP